MILLPTPAVPLGAVHLIKRANRTAQRRIAAGELPGPIPPGLEEDPDPEADRALTDGSVG